MRSQFSCSELVEVVLGRASSERRAEFLEHHAELCATCRDELSHLAAATAKPEHAAELARFRVLISESKLERLARVEEVARREFRALMRIPAAARRQRIHRALSRFRNPVLVDLLLAESRKQMTADPWAALALADCAQDAAIRIPHQEFGAEWAMTCLARAHAFRGNALRVIGDLRQADTSLSFAWALFSEDGNGDPLVEAELLSFLSSLRSDQVRINESEGFLDRALAIYRSLGEEHRVARMLVKKSVVLASALKLDRALEAATAALSAVSPDSDPKLYLSAVHNQLFILRDVGRAAEAWELFQASSAHYQRFADSWTRLRQQWLGGTLLAELGRHDEAERALLQARAGFDTESLRFDAAVVGLDLACLYLEMGRTSEVRALAEEVVPVFLAQGLKQDTAAALFLFQESARREAATGTMVRQLIASLRDLRPRAGRADR